MLPLPLQLHSSQAQPALTTLLLMGRKRRCTPKSSLALPASSTKRRSWATAKEEARKRGGAWTGVPLAFSEQDLLHDPYYSTSSTMRSSRIRWFGYFVALAALMLATTNG